MKVACWSCQHLQVVVQMNSATKLFERFWQPEISVEDEMKIKVLVMQNQQLIKPNGRVRFFEEWKVHRFVKSCTLEPAGLFTTKD